MKNLITALALTLTAATVVAQEVTPTTMFDTFTSTLTRAQVRDELREALASGWRPMQGEASILLEVQPSGLTRTRVEVCNELQAALAEGEPLFFGEARPDGMGARDLSAPRHTTARVM